MAKYLITGGAGFIGSHIAEELVKRGEEVRVLDNFLTGKKENLDTFIKEIELIEGDIRNYKTCQDAVLGIDYVLHQAALPSVPRADDFGNKFKWNPRTGKEELQKIQDNIFRKIGSDPTRYAKMSAAEKDQLFSKISDTSGVTYRIEKPVLL